MALVISNSYVEKIITLYNSSIPGGHKGVFKNHLPISE